jgi:hypothetical protein
MSSTTNYADGLATDDAIRAVVARLARPHRSGGTVIERAAILAEGTDSAAIVAWILAHSGRPEADAPPAASRGLYGGSSTNGAVAARRGPSRYLLPAGALAVTS